MSAPRLLDKKTVNAEVAAQKKRQIDEGLTLAKKVDALRETKQIEEGNLEKFRSETTQAVRIEIDALVRQRDAVKKDIGDRKQELTILQLPLDEKWSEVNRSAEIILNKEIKVYERSHNLDIRQTEIENEEREIEVEKGRTFDLSRRTAEALEQADKTLTDAHKDSEVIRHKAQAILASAEAREHVAEMREKDVSVREEAVERKDKKLDLYETDLFNRELLLKDNYKSLEIAKLEIYG